MEKEIKYYPLHVHTSIGSIGDSILDVNEYVARGKRIWSGRFGSYRSWKHERYVYLGS